MHLQRDLKDKGCDDESSTAGAGEQSFFLMAQPIFGVRGDVYHEILLRL